MVPLLKNRLPFRLGTPSYVIPDDIIPNVRFLADQVDDVEIVLFESSEFSNIPSKETVRILRELSAKHDLTYTVHLPIDIHTGHADSGERRRAVDVCRRIIMRMEQLDPYAYVLHLVGDRRGDTPSDDMLRWQAFHRDSVRAIIQEVSPHKLCIENLDYPFEWVSDLVGELCLSVCTDIGHLLLRAEDVHRHLDRYLASIRVVHLHGIENGVDHRSVHHLDPMLLDALLQRLWNADTERVVTLEIFNVEDFRSSIRCLADGLNAKRRNLGAGVHPVVPLPKSPLP